MDLRKRLDAIERRMAARPLEPPSLPRVQFDHERFAALHRAWYAQAFPPDVPPDVRAERWRKVMAFYRVEADDE
jgi:hypothetical protein